MTRYACVIRLKEEHLEEYLRLHENVWPAVYERLSKSNLRNFTIFLRELGDGHHLFMVYEYHGTDHEADMQAVADDPTTQEWWKLTDPTQYQIATAAPGDKWSFMQEVCHHDLEPSQFAHT